MAELPDHLTALERRADDLAVFSDCERRATDWVAEHGTDALVEELRQARVDKRRIKLGTANTLILLQHIDRLEGELAKQLSKVEADVLLSWLGVGPVGGHFSLAREKLVAIATGKAES